MSIKESLVKVKKHPKNFIYYSGKFNEEGGFYIVPVSSLSIGSKVLITKICDNCKDEIIRPYKDIIKQRKHGKDYCWKCGNNTKEALKNKSESHKGFVWSNESKEKASKTHTGMKHSDETRHKIRSSIIEKTSSVEWKDWMKKRIFETRSLDAYIKKYGEIEGEKLYKIERKSKNPFSLEYWIIKNNGNVEKAVDSLSNFQRRDLKWFKLKFGDKEGEEKYNDFSYKRCYNNKNKYSKSSQNFIKKIINFLQLEETFLYFGEDEWIVYLYDNERKSFDYNKRILSLDFYDRKNNIVIEYDGDFWHSKDEQILDDEKRDEILKNRGMKVVRIKESDFLKNENKVLIEVKKIYENI